jgi:hypothetical protein
MKNLLTNGRTAWTGLLRFTSYLVLLVLSVGPATPQITNQLTVVTQLHEFLNAEPNHNAGILFGRLDSLNSVPQLWTAGSIACTNDLRLGCPTAKPLLVFIALKEGINLDSTIDNWFPEDSGYTGARTIKVKHLLLNSSGIRDYVSLAPIHPDSVFTPDNSIERVYRHQPLLFEPGTNVDYSNTNFNLLGRILEMKTGKSVPQLFREYFQMYAPSLRLDDGKGNYPSGYPTPWPYHWSAPGFGGGFIGSAADAMRVFCYIATQPEFKLMTRWYTPNGSISSEVSENLLGFGIFGKSHFARHGQAEVYEGNMGPALMILARLQGSVFYIATAHNMEPSKLSDLFQKLIQSSLQ